jgi:hypothetical protein
VVFSTVARKSLVHELLRRFAAAEIAAPTPHVGGSLLPRRLDADALRSSRDLPDPSFKTTQGFGTMTRLCNLFMTQESSLAAHLRVALPRRFSELAVFDARLYIRVRPIDEPA